MSTVYMKSGNIWRLTDNKNMDFSDNLPVGLYRAMYTPDMGYFLQETEPFKIPEKLYGNVNQRAERILNTFHKRENSTGVLLAGEKGSGKTLLSKVISVRSVLPVILVATPFSGDSFKIFMESINQECIILFDEFEKVYDDETQEQMLSFFDGVSTQKKLFILTINDLHRLNDNLVNRPGRMYYNIRYGNLEREFIIEYCTDNLNDKSQIDKIVNAVPEFDSFNFDMLATLVEEMNRYDSSIEECLSLLNVKKSKYFDFCAEKFNMTFYDSDDNLLEVENETELNSNPLREMGRNGYVYVEFTVVPPKKDVVDKALDEENDDDYYDRVMTYFCHLKPQNLVKVIPETDSYEFSFVAHGKKFKAIFTKEPSSSKHYYGAF